MVRRDIIGIVCNFIFLLAVNVSAEVNLSTGSLEIGVKEGVIVSIKNLLTGETYTTGTASPAISGLMPVPEHAPDYGVELTFSCDGNTRPVRQENATETLKNKRLETAWEEDGQRMNTVFAVDDSTGGIRVVQIADRTSGNLYGIQLGIGVLSSELSLIVPGPGGTGYVLPGGKGPANVNGVAHSWQWPTIWSAAMCLVQGEKGGLLLYADDPQLHHKEMCIETTDSVSGFGIGLVSCNNAPFTEKEHHRSVTWKLVPYEGDWLVGAALYKKYMAEAWSWTKLSDHPSEWMRTIGFYVLFDSEEILKDTSVLDALAQRVEPAKTICYVRCWRLHGYDVAYPDYSANAHGARFIEYGTKLGFHMQPHLDLYAVAPGQPEYGELERYQIRSPFAGKPVGWQWSDMNSPTRFAAITPASREFRDMFTQKCMETLSTLGCDTLLTDVAWWTMNDGQGLVNGLNLVQGLDRMLDGIRMSMGGRPLASENTNEVIARHEAVAHIGPHLDNADYLHPIGTYLFGDGVYLTMPYTVPTTVSVAYSETAEKNSERLMCGMGALPSLSLVYADSILNPSPAELRMYERGGLWCKHGLKPYFGTPWSGGVIMMWRGQHGELMTARRQGDGVALYWLKDGKETLCSEPITPLLKKRD